MRWSSAALLSVWVASMVACIEPALVPCGEKLCPRGLTCVADELCATAGEITACIDVMEGGTCSVDGSVGRCDRGVCIAGGCGNGVIDSDEVCDDGNMLSGDGCRADCRKIEVCGDAAIDEGEGCDDGNTNAADGCDACVPTRWSATAVIGGNANATVVGLTHPFGVGVDLLGNFYIADTENHRVRRVDVTGVMTTVAGTGTPGLSGDNGPATSAQLDEPNGVAVDGLGNLYIADSLNARIRRVDPAGVITTIAGGGIGGVVLNVPSGVAVDGLGNVYIADTNSQRIRKLDPLTGLVTTFAGTAGGPAFSGDGLSATAATAKLAYPTGVALDGHGKVYIADSGNHCIRLVVAGTITTFAGIGTMSGFQGDGFAATTAKLASPSGIAVDSSGNVYVADTNNDRIRKIDTNGIITTIAGTGTSGPAGDNGAATAAQLDNPTGVAVDGAGNVYIADEANQRTRRVDTAGIITTVAGGLVGPGSDHGAATSAPLDNPGEVTFDNLGNFYIADTFHHSIRRVDTTGVITTVAGTGTMGFSGDNGPATLAQLNNPQGVVVDQLGNLYIADTVDNRVRKVDLAGVITTVAGFGSSTELDNPSGVAVDSLGNLFIADTNNHRIRRVDKNTGDVTTVVGTGFPGYSGVPSDATSAQLSSPRGVSVDGAGNLYIADTANHAIRRVDKDTNIITTVAGDGTPGSSAARLDTPWRVVADGLGNLYIADTNNRRIQRVDPASVITTVAGTGIILSNGDGGPALAADLYNPGGVAVDAVGNVYIADTWNDRIRRVDLNQIITTVAGQVDPDGMGPFAQAHLADPRALVLAGPRMLVAGGNSRTVQAANTVTSWLDAVVGRYPPHVIATGVLARFRDQNFGTVSGVAYDAATGSIYLTESSKNRLQVVTMVDPDDENTWTIATLANTAGTAGFVDGTALTAQFRGPSGLYFDAAGRQLYVADVGNHVIRSIDLSTHMVHTIAGTPETRGFFGDGLAATAAFLYAPQAITRCANGDLFVADTGNQRIRRIAASTGMITTVLGDGVAASSGEGHPAMTFPVNAPLGLACDAIGNLFITSTTTVRVVPADSNGVVDGTGEVQTIYGAPPRLTFPSSVTTCLTGLAIVDATVIQVADSCTGLLVELRREPK